MPAISKPQTTRQAKASFKARGRPTLTDQQVRQLERAAELEKRAVSAKEAEKRRAAAAKRRVENEKEEAERQRSETQRNRDRFGFVGSQFCLWKFFPQNRGTCSGAEAGDEDVFGDEDLDDESLLRASEPAIANRPCFQDKTHDCTVSVSPTVVRQPRELQSPLNDNSGLATKLHDMEDFWDQLDTSSQIARDLEPPLSTEHVLVKDLCSLSFTSADFDLTAGELEELKMPQSTSCTLDEKAQSMMPPPPVPTPNHCAGSQQHIKAKRPISVSSSIPGAAQTESQQSAVISPALMLANEIVHAKCRTSVPVSNHSGRLRSCAQTAQPYTRPFKEPHLSGELAQREMSAKKTIRGPFLSASSLYCSPDLGFNMSQLETMVDDDIQLTQTVHG